MANLTLTTLPTQSQLAYKYTAITLYLVYNTHKKVEKGFLLFNFYGLLQTLHILFFIFQLQQ